MANEKNDHDHGPENPGGEVGRHGSSGPGGGGDHGGHGEKITVLVNEKRVVFDKEQQTGISIKQAAIVQGVAIQPDFVLSIERGGGKTELIGDDEVIKLRDGDRFLAIPNDDNS
ncbi:MAG: multiubiquitin domain-containing protein [Bradyrhizobium sp.]|jgi:hypothetical protein|uniref:multiubiquitin domain-containing protein n=1 Tax=Bradyrhizobium sp. TaxID=376 RepID=UPI003C71D527